MKKISWITGIVLLSILIAVYITACGDSNSSGTPETTTPTPTPTPAPNATPTPTPTPAPNATPTPTPTPSNVTVNVQTALASIGTNGLNQNFTISGTYSTDQATGQGNETVKPATATTLNGTPVLLETSTFSGTIVVKNHNVTISQTDTAYLNPANYDFIAGEDSANSSYSGSRAYYKTYATVAYPTTVQAGASGLVATTKLYSDPSMATQIGTGTLSYSVAADGSSTSTLLVMFVEDQYDMSNTHTLENTITYRVDTSGNGSLVSVVGINYGGDANSTAGATAYNITFTFQ